MVTSSALDKNISIIILRYFNPVGSDKNHLLGENPNGIPNNLVPYIVKVATKKLESLNVFGNDYDTVDGSGVRDYIHVIDLAIGHVKAIEYMKNNKGILKVNLGTGKGNSVLELIKKFEEVNKVKIPYKIVERRKGDIATCYADTKKVKELLNFTTAYNIEDMLQDAYLAELNNK